MIVAVATWQLILHTVAMIRNHPLDPGDAQAFQSLFGMILTLLIALEFKHSLMVVLHDRRNVVQTRAVILIALLAIVRRFIVLDLYQTAPSTVAALAGAALALGIVFWLVRSQEYHRRDGEKGQRANLASPIKDSAGCPTQALFWLEWDSSTSGLSRPAACSRFLAVHSDSISTRPSSPVA